MLLKYLLSFIILVLIVGLGSILMLPRRMLIIARWLALLTSCAALLSGVVVLLLLNRLGDFQCLFRFDILPLYNLNFALGVDGLSLVFLLLTLFIMPICVLAAWNMTFEVKNFLSYLLVIEALLILTFTTVDLFYFYVFFESILLPMFILIGYWGARERKIKAAYYFFLYTLFGSLFMLFGLFYLYFLVGSTHFFVLLDISLPLNQQKVIWLCFFMAFAIKIPMFPFHIWLPEAHVEAPTVGSIILASLLLKLGGYGFLRFSLTLLRDASYEFSPLLQTFALLGVLYASLTTMRQIDLKRIIAYSSFAHMNLVVLGLFSGEQQGVEGAVYLMVAHGIVSSAMFFCVGVLYDRYHSRLVRYYGGLVTVMPIFAFFLLVFTLANMSLPGTCNFIGELFIFLGLFNTNALIICGAVSSVVLSAIYSLLLFNRIIFGTLKKTYIMLFTDLSCREASVLLSLLIPTLGFGLTASFVLDLAQYPLQAMFSTIF